MKVARVLGSSAAAAVFVLVPQAAFADDGYGAPGPGSSNQVSAPSTPAETGALPSTGSSALDAGIAGAGLLLLVGGGAVVVASRRKQLETA